MLILNRLLESNFLLQVQGQKKRGVWTLYFVEAEELGLIKIGKTQNLIVGSLCSMYSESPDRLKLLCTVE